jgi:hypothetical protein
VSAVAEAKGDDDNSPSDIGVRHWLTPAPSRRAIRCAIFSAVEY